MCTGLCWRTFGGGVYFTGTSLLFLIWHGRQFWKLLKASYTGIPAWLIWESVTGFLVSRSLQHYMWDRLKKNHSTVWKYCHKGCTRQKKQRDKYSILAGQRGESPLWNTPPSPRFFSPPGEEGKVEGRGGSIQPSWDHFFYSRLFSLACSLATIVKNLLESQFPRFKQVATATEFISL